MKRIIIFLFNILVVCIIANATNFVSNGDFEASSSTGSSYWNTAGSNHTYSIETTSPIAGLYSAKATIGTAASSASSQGLYTYVTLPKAATYTVTFTVKSSVDFTATASVGVQGALVQSYGNFTWLGNSTLNSLTANISKTISYDVTTTTTTTGLCKLAVYYGGLAANATILIDNVTVTEKTGTSLTNTNLCNGDFETVSGTGLYNPSGYTYNGLTSGGLTKSDSEKYYGWSLLRKGIDASTYTSADMTAAIDNTAPLSGSNSMKLTSTGTATAVTTDLQFDWVFGGIKDANYTVSFKAKTDAAGGYNLRVALQSWGGNYYINEQTCALTTSVQTFTLTSTATFAYSDGRNILRFLLGTLPGGVSVWLDDIVIAVKQTPTITWTQSALSFKSTDIPYVSLTAATSNMSSVTTPASSPVTYASDNTNVVTMNGTNLTIVGAGTANITASEAADASGFYAAATPVSKSVTVTSNGYRGALISNGTFELGTDASSNVSWWQKTGTTANFTYAIDNTGQISGSNCAKLTVTTPGSSTQCALFQFMTLPKPSTYTVSFKAKASTACSIQAALVQSYQPFSWVNGGSSTFNLTTSTQTFSYDITTTSAIGLCKFAFYFGNVLTDIYIDDVTIVEKTPLTDANMCNGDFEATINNAIYSPTNYTYNGVTTGTPDATTNSLYYGWSLVKLTASTAAMTATTETGVDKISGNQSIKLTSTGTATSTSTDLQFAYIFAGIKDKQYNIYFKAKASAATTIGVALQALAWSSNPSSTYLAEQTVNLTTSVQTFGFTTSNAFLQSDERNVLQFLLGKLPNGVSVWIDDVVIQPVQTTVITPAISWSQTLTGLSVGSSSVSLTASSNYTPASSPAAASIAYGSSNSAVVSISGSNMTIVGAGTANITAYQAADAAGNYSAATAVAQSVTIAKGTPTVTVTPVGSYTYNGSPQGPNACTKGGSTGAVTYNYVGVNGTSYSASYTAPTNAGSYTVTATVAADANYNAASSSATAFTISKATPTLSVSGTQSFTYNGSAQGPATISYNGDGTTSLLYTSTDGGGYSSATAPTNAGAYQVVASATAGINYSAATSAAYAFTITSGAITVSTNTNISTLSPTSATDVTVNSGCELTVNGDASVKSITVQPGGKLTLSSGTLTVATTNGITLQSSSDGTATFVDNNTSSPKTVTGTAEQYLDAARNWYTTSPIVGATVPTGQTYYSYDETGSNTSFTAPATAYWVAVTEGSAINPMKGYIAQPGAATTLSYTGTFNTGNQTIALTRTPGKTKEGFNLVANPYPSYLNWAMVDTTLATGAKIMSSIWYRTKTTGNAAYTFDTYNGNLNVATNNGATKVTNLIPPMQAFWVRVKEGQTAGTLTFTNAMRAHVDNTLNKFKAPAQNTASQQLLRLQVSNGVNADETIICFNPNASNGFDSYDSQKLSNNTASIPEIFTLAGTEQLVINGMNSLTPNQEIPLGFTTGQSNAFSIKATEVSNFDAGIQVILNDNQTNTQWNLSDGSPYNFSSDITSSNTSRFSIIFKSASINTGNTYNNLESNSVLIYRNENNLITIKCVNGVTGRVTASVFNAIGQKLEEKTLTSSITVLDKSFNSGVYVVSVIADGKSTTQKVTIN